MPLYDSSTSRTKFHACCCPTNSRRARSSNRSFTSSRLTALRHAANALTTPKLSMGVAQFCWSTFFGQFCCCSRSQPAKRAVGAVKSSEPHRETSLFPLSLPFFSSSRRRSVPGVVVVRMRCRDVSRSASFSNAPAQLLLFGLPQDQSLCGIRPLSFFSGPVLASGLGSSDYGPGALCDRPCLPCPPPIPQKGPPAAAEGHSRAPSPHLIFRAPSAVWFHLRSVLSGCMLIATGGVHLA